jgi:hypothetical protein
MLLVSEEHYDQANTDIVFPLMRELAGDQPQHSIERATESFDLHGLVIPGGNSSRRPRAGVSGNDPAIPFLGTV